MFTITNIYLPAEETGQTSKYHLKPDTGGQVSVNSSTTDISLSLCFEEIENMRH